MKYAMGFLAVLVVGVFLFAGVCFAETVYVGGVMKITMRTGPGTKHKIITMADTADRLEVVERGRDWSRVRNSEGKQGWVLTRFITREVPLKFKVEELEKKNDELNRLLEKIKEENRNFEATRKKLKVIEDAYLQLKKRSSEFLELEAAHEKMTTDFTRQTERIVQLESRLNKEDIKWFLSGGGVLFVGILLGLTTRKKKQRSLV